MPELSVSVLGSGSGGNVTFVSDGRTRVLLDAGLACREIERRLNQIGVAPRDLDAILLSHEHGDHSRGAPRFAWKHGVPVYATEGTYRNLKKNPERPFEWVRVRSSHTIRLDRLHCDLFPTPHDAAEPVGFRLRRGAVAFGHVTDIGHISEEVLDGLRATQGILIEANHDIHMLREGPYPETLKHRVGGRFGHLSNEALARYLEYRLPDSVRHLWLAHLSGQNNHEQLALDICVEALTRRGGSQPRVHLTYQDRITDLVRLTESRTEAADQRQGVLAF